MSLGILRYTEKLSDTLALNKYVSEMQTHQINKNKNIHSVSATLQLQSYT